MPSRQESCCAHSSSLVPSLCPCLHQMHTAVSPFSPRSLSFLPLLSPPALLLLLLLLTP